MTGPGLGPSLTSGAFLCKDAAEAHSFTFWAWEGRQSIDHPLLYVTLRAREHTC